MLGCEILCVMLRGWRIKNSKKKNKNKQQWNETTGKCLHYVYFFRMQHTYLSSLTQPKQAQKDEDEHEKNHLFS